MAKIDNIIGVLKITIGQHHNTILQKQSRDSQLNALRNNKSTTFDSVKVRLKMYTNDMRSVFMARINTFSGSENQNVKETSV